MAFSQTSNIGVAPPRIEISAAPGDLVTETVRVVSQTGGEIRVEAGDWTLDPFGEVLFFPGGSLERSASSWVALETDVLAIPNESSVDFRFSLQVPPSGIAGSYWTMLFFTAVPGSQEPRVGSVSVPRIGVAVYVTVIGSELPELELIDFDQPTEEGLALVLANSGNTVVRLGGKIELRDEAGETFASLPVPDVPVLPESERELSFSLPEDLEDGFYVAVAFVESSAGGLLVGELPIDVGE